MLQSSGKYITGQEHRDDMRSTNSSSRQRALAVAQQGGQLDGGVGRWLDGCINASRAAVGSQCEQRPLPLRQLVPHGVHDGICLRSAAACCQGC